MEHLYRRVPTPVDLTRRESGSRDRVARMQPGPWVLEPWDDVAVARARAAA
jgi:hypothetical protein